MYWLLQNPGCIDTTSRGFYYRRYSKNSAACRVGLREIEEDLLSPETLAKMLLLQLHQLGDHPVDGNEARRIAANIPKLPDLLKAAALLSGPQTWPARYYPKRARL